MKNSIIILFFALATFTSCTKETVDPKGQSNDPSPTPHLNISFRFDSTLVRLNDVGQLSTIPDSHAAVSPLFNYISTHYIELSENFLTPLGDGEIIYQGEETIKGGSIAIDFKSAILASENEIFLRIPLSEIAHGGYTYVRSSLSYQNYRVPFESSGVELEGTIASFVGYDTYIDKYVIDKEEITVNANKKQGYFGFEVDDEGLPVQIQPITGQAPEGATTVPNPISSTSPIPPGSCIVTGEFESYLIIDGTETEDINMVLTVSTNNSFEFIDLNKNGKWNPDLGEKVVDMGIRGLFPIIE